MGAAMLTARLFQVLVYLGAAVAVFPVAAGLAESVAVATLVALGAVAVIVVPGLQTTILFSRCCSGGVQEGFNVEFGHGLSTGEAGWVCLRLGFFFSSSAVGKGEWSGSLQGG